ncbi:MJ0042-type zinc finger domain-containing protein [Devosia sp.]|uniref:MJ0042-type zinc finger domain-containing protein n=1 Tax=Devosia sp. TaxID=1871048 RepID=UPI0032633FCC
MIITCPHCQTRYQVTYEAIGAAGRKVQCATCNQAWQQGPPTSAEELQNDRLQDDVHEDRLDEAFSEAEHAAAQAGTKPSKAKRDAAPSEPASTVDPAVQRKRQRAFTQRQSSLFAQLPMARLRRAARVLGVVVLLAIVVGSYFGRTKMVEMFPAMAGVYAAIGLNVNVLGLEFADVATLRTLVDGKEVLMVSATIVGMMPEPVVVPQVVVTLIGPDGKGIYEWSVRPEARDLKAGQHSSLKTQLTLPPGDIVRVKLTFAGGNASQTAASADAMPVDAAPSEVPPAATPPAPQLAANTAEPDTHSIPAEHK